MHHNTVGSGVCKPDMQPHGAAQQALCPTHTPSDRPVRSPPAARHSYLALLPMRSLKLLRRQSGGPQGESHTAGCRSTLSSALPAGSLQPFNSPQQPEWDQHRRRTVNKPLPQPKPSSPEAAKLALSASSPVNIRPPQVFKAALAAQGQSFAGQLGATAGQLKAATHREGTEEHVLNSPRTELTAARLCSEILGMQEAAAAREPAVNREAAAFGGDAARNEAAQTAAHTANKVAVAAVKAVVVNEAAAMNAATAAAIKHPMYACEPAVGSEAVATGQSAAVSAAATGIEEISGLHGPAVAAAVSFGRSSSGGRRGSVGTCERASTGGWASHRWHSSLAAMGAAVAAHVVLG